MKKVVFTTGFFLLLATLFTACGSGNGTTDKPTQTVTLTFEHTSDKTIELLAGHDYNATLSNIARGDSIISSNTSVMQVDSVKYDAGNAQIRIHAGLTNTTTHSPLIAAAFIRHNGTNVRELRVAVYNREITFVNECREPIQVFDNAHNRTLNLKEHNGTGHLGIYENSQTSYFMRNRCESGYRCVNNEVNGSVGQAEFTFKSEENNSLKIADNLDNYDVSNINGINVPITITPDYTNANFDLPNNKDYRWCGIPGAADPLTAVTPTGYKLGSLRYFGCDWKFDFKLDSYRGESDPIKLAKTAAAFNLIVAPVKKSTAECRYASREYSCGSDNNYSCGLAFTDTGELNASLQCGTFAGFFTIAQLCSKGGTRFKVDGTYIICDEGKDNINTSFYHAAICDTGALVGGKPQHPATGSCYQKYSLGLDTCCGYYDVGVKLDNDEMTYLPSFENLYSGGSEIFRKGIAPFVERVTEGCPTAYGYQYGDGPVSMSCTGGVDTSKANDLAYTVTLCPGGSEVQPLTTPRTAPAYDAAVPALEPQPVTPTLNMLTFVAIDTEIEVNGFKSGTTSSPVAVTLHDANSSDALYYTLDSDTKAEVTLAADSFLYVHAAGTDDSQCYYRVAVQEHNYELTEVDLPGMSYNCSGHLQVLNNGTATATLQYSKAYIVPSPPTPLEIQITGGALYTLTSDLNESKSKTNYVYVSVKKCTDANFTTCDLDVDTNPFKQLQTGQTNNWYFYPYKHSDIKSAFISVHAESNTTSATCEMRYEFTTYGRVANVKYNNKNCLENGSSDIGLMVNPTENPANFTLNGAW